MRRSALLAAVLLLASGPLVRAAGTCTVTHNAIGNVRTIVAACTADASDGSFPNTTLPRFEGRLLSIETNPGATAPQDNYDVTVEDAHGLDVLLGTGANRDTATTERAAVVFTSTSVHPIVDDTDTLTLKVAGNNVNSAVTVIVLHYALGG
jgi:hypothetical protein